MEEKVKKAEMKNTRAEELSIVSNISYLDDGNSHLRHAVDRRFCTSRHCVVASEKFKRLKR